MEVFRHARRRSRFHALDREERGQARDASRQRTHESRKPLIYHDIDEDWKRERQRAAFIPDDDTTTPAADQQDPQPPESATPPEDKDEETDDEQH